MGEVTCKLKGIEKGSESEDILTSFTFDDSADQNNYDRVKEKFDHHFTAKKNVICERAKFNQRELGQDEPLENLITDLYRPAEFCEYGSLRDEMMRDRFVVGLRNDNLSGKLQRNSDLIQEQAVQQARQSENSKKKKTTTRSNQIAPGSSKRGKPHSFEIVETSKENYIQ